MPWPHFSTFFFWFFTAKHNVMWCEISLCSIGVSCVLSQLFVHLQPCLWGGRAGRKGLDTVKALLSSTGILTPSWWENQNSTIGDVMKGITSMAGRASTAVLVRSLPAGWGELLLRRGGHSWSNMSPSGSQGRKYVHKGKQINQKITKAVRQMEYITSEETRRCFVCLAQGREVKQVQL